VPDRLGEREAVAEALREAVALPEGEGEPLPLRVAAAVPLGEREALAEALGEREATTQLAPTHCQACRRAPVSGKEASSGEAGSGPRICSVCVAARAWQLPAPQTLSSARLVKTMDVSCAAPRLTLQYSFAVKPALL